MNFSHKMHLVTIRLKYVVLKNNSNLKILVSTSLVVYQRNIQQILDTREQRSCITVCTCGDYSQSNLIPLGWKTKRLSCFGVTSKSLGRVMLKAISV